MTFPALLELLRSVNIVLGLGLGLSFCWAAFRPVLGRTVPGISFLALGLSLFLLVFAWGTFNSRYFLARPPTTTTAYFTVALVWLSIGLVKLKLSRRPGRGRRSRGPR